MKKDKKFSYEAPLVEEAVFVSSCAFCDSVTEVDGGNEDFTETDPYTW